MTKDNAKKIIDTFNKKILEYWPQENELSLPYLQRAILSYMDDNKIKDMNKGVDKYWEMLNSRFS